MEMFNYHNIWFTISFWGVMTTMTLYVLMTLIIQNNPFGKKFVATLMIAVINAVMLIGFFVTNKDKTEAQNDYSNKVVEHIKEAGKFDKVEGKYTFDKEQASSFKAYYGEESLECLAGVEPGSDKMDFGCGVEFTPLEEIHKNYLKSKAESEKGK